jgi:hypothetical protein
LLGYSQLIPLGGTLIGLRSLFRVVSFLSFWRVNADLIAMLGGLWLALPDTPHKDLGLSYPAVVCHLWIAQSGRLLIYVPVVVNGEDVPKVPHPLSSLHLYLLQC